MPPTTANGGELKRAWSGLDTLAATSLFPMYVLPVMDFLGMTHAEPHQVLMVGGVVHECRPHDSQVVAFVSHQWCGERHADPSFAQLHILQGMFQRAAEGTLQIETDLFSAALYRTKVTVRKKFLRTAMDWVLWLDYFSVPQPDGPGDPQHLRRDLHRAVSSLPSYVEASDVFLVLAPFVRHEAGQMLDYRTWKARGWCRLERLSQQLSSRRSMMLLVKRSDAVFEVGAHDYFLEPVGLGDFSFDEDRARLTPVVHRLIAKKVQALHQAGAWEDYRYLMAWFPMLTKGLDINWQDNIVATVSFNSVCAVTPDGPRDVAARFQHLLCLDGARSCCPKPLLIAAGLGDGEIISALLLSRANVSCKRGRSLQKFMHMAGQQPLHVAAQCGHITAIDTLLGHRASVAAKDRVRCTPLFYAASAGCCRTVRHLLRARCDVTHPSGLGSITALEYAIIFGRSAIVRLFLSSGARLECTPDGLSSLHVASIFGSGAEIVRALIEARVGLEDRLRPRTGGFVWTFLSMLALPYYFGCRGLFALVGYHAPGSTPLMSAVIHGNTMEALVLLEAGADPERHSRRGFSVRELADEFGSPLPPARAATLTS